MASDLRTPQSAKLPAWPHRAGLRLAVVVEDMQLPLDEGVRKTYSQLVRSLQKAGAQLSVFACHDTSSVVKDGFPLPENKLRIGYRFSQSLRRQAPEAILFMPSGSGTPAALVRAALIKKQASGSLIALLNVQYRALPRHLRLLGLQQHIDLILTQCPDSTDVFRSLGFTTAMLPGGVDLETFQPLSVQEKKALRRKQGFDDSDRIILHVGHCRRDRNVSTLAALARSGFRTILVASTSTAIEHALLDELRQAGVIVVTDFVESIQRYYQLADCYVFPVVQATEAVDAPLSVLEAMACDLPVVTTRLGGLPSMFEAGNGLYFADAQEEIAGLVGQAVTADGCATRRKVSPYSWDALALRILEVLRERARP